jgi:hypothetical protein
MKKMITRNGGRRWSAIGAALLVAVGAGAAGCGGNYSNEDVDFQLALPESSDITVKLPQALVVAGAAEYYLATRDVVGKANAFVVAVIGIVDAIRSIAPSERRGDVRLWGPFPNERDPAFELRLTMVRSGGGADGLSFDYQIEFHRVGDAALPWQPLISGNFVPSGGTRLGRGRIVLDLVEARRQGYPAADFNQLEYLEIDYQRRTPPFTTTMVIRNVDEPTPPTATYAYAENVDRSGEMTFVFRPELTPTMPVELHTRWLASGAGRGDARVLEGGPLLTGLRGIDCWAPDTRPTYVRRDWAAPARREEGDPASCVLGPPAP